MKVLFDVDVVLDVLLDRQPHAEASAQLMALVEKGTISGCLCATAVTTLYYLASKVTGRPRARTIIRRLLGLFEVAAVNRSTIEEALELPFGDFEDAVTHAAAAAAGADAIATRNVRHYRRSHLPAHTPADILLLLQKR